MSSSNKSKTTTKRELKSISSLQSPTKKKKTTKITEEQLILIACVPITINIANLKHELELSFKNLKGIRRNTKYNKNSRKYEPTKTVEILCSDEVQYKEILKQKEMFINEEEITFFKKFNNENSITAFIFNLPNDIQNKEIENDIINQLEEFTVLRLFATFPTRCTADEKSNKFYNKMVVIKLSTNTNVSKIKEHQVEIKGKIYKLIPGKTDAENKKTRIISKLNKFLTKNDVENLIKEKGFKNFSISLKVNDEFGGNNGKCLIVFNNEIDATNFDKISSELNLVSYFPGINNFNNQINITTNKLETENKIINNKLIELEKKLNDKFINYDSKLVETEKIINSKLDSFGIQLTNHLNKNSSDMQQYMNQLFQKLMVHNNKLPNSSNKNNHEQSNN